MSSIRITIVETVIYANDYDLDDLYERWFADEITREVFDELTPQEIAELIRDDSEIDKENFEYHGDVGGQVWTAEPSPPSPQLP